MRNVILAVVCILLHVNMYANIRINEVMQSNVNGIMDDLNEYPDSWVELYNDDSTPFDFTGYSISISKDYTESFPLMDTTIVAPKGYLLIYCDKEDDRGARHAHFRLNVEEDTLYVFDPVGHIVDSLIVPEMLAPDVAYGRITDGNDTLSYFKKATPNAPNGGFYTTKILKKPEFSVKGGIYHQPVVLRLRLQGQCPADAVVRYTTNGSEPTEESPIAPDSIVITETAVIRAKTFSDSALSKLSKTETYIIPDREYTLPIISIVTDSANMYDDEIGIMVEGTYGITHPDILPTVTIFGNLNFFYPWKRPVNFEYFDAGVSDKSIINQMCETEIGGNTSAYFRIKSLNLKANKRFGDNKFSYPFWSDKPDVKKSKCLYLRNSGQDYNCLHFRDAMIQMSFGQNVDVDWQASQPVVVLINGKYYGLLNLREKVNADFVWSNYNKLENIDMLTENCPQSKAGDLMEYYSYRNFISDSTTTLAQLDSMIDLNEFMNYFILSVVYCNKDFPGNNQIMWRERKEGFQWRYICKDNDVTANLTFNSVWNFPYFNYILRKEPFEEGVNNEYGCKVFMKTMSFPEFSNQVIDRLSVYIGTFVSVASCTERFDSLVGLIAPEIPYFYNEIERSTDDWEFWKNHYMDFIEKRIPYLYKHTHEFFGLGDTTSVKISTSKKKLYFNSVPVKNGQFDGCYYYGRPFYLSTTDTSFSYVGDSIAIVGEDSVSRKEDGCWYVSYVLNDAKVVQRFFGKSLYFVIPEGATNVQITDEYQVKACDSLEKVTISVLDNACGLPTEIAPLYGVDGSDSFGNVLTAERVFDTDTFYIGNHTVEWRYVDMFGDTTFCMQSLEVVDMSAPVLDNCSNSDTLLLVLRSDQNAICSSEELAPYAPIAYDNCSVQIRGTLVESEDTFYVGLSTVRWLLTDAQGNATLCQQVLNVVDTIKPVLDGCEALPEISVAIKTDACGVQIDELGIEALKAADGGSYVEGELADAVFAIGKNETYWRFMDASGNTLYCPQTILVVDSFAPRYADCDSMPKLQIDIVDDKCGLPVEELSLATPTAYDNCGKTIAGKLLSDDTVYVGESLLTWVFTDEAGNTTRCQQTISLNDRYAPVYAECGNLPDVSLEINDYSCGLDRAVLNLPVLYAEDNCSAKVEGVLVAPDYLPIGKTVLTWMFVDAAGNRSECQQTVEVIDHMPPFYEKCFQMPVLTLSVTDNSKGCSVSSMSIPAPVAIDNCSKYIQGACELPEVLPIGEHTIQWHFTDATGNLLVCEQLISVVDRSAPVYEDCDAMPLVEYDLTELSCAVSLEQLQLDVPVAVDNCDSLVSGQLIDSPAVCMVGDNELTWLFADKAGNRTLCKQEVVVYDRCAPYFDCNSIDTFVVDLPLNANEVDASLVEIPLLSAIDNCSVRVAGHLEGDAFYKIGSNQIAWTFTDIYGNSSTCSQIVKGVKHFMIQTYPNPVEEFLCVDGTEVGDEIVVVNSAGLCVKQQKATENPTIIKFDGQTPGIYFIRINDKLHKILKK